MNLILCILVAITVVDFPFLTDGGWPDPNPVMAFSLRLALLLPHAVAGLTAAMLALAVWAARSRSCSSAAAKCYGLISMGSVLFAALLLAWGALGIAR